MQTGASPGGVACALAAYGLWGVTPVYWKAVASVPAGELLGQRIVWSCVVGALLLSLARSWPRAAAIFRSPRALATIALTGALIAGNWLTFIWAVNHEQVLATSLGYYINPLLSVALGAIFLGERLRRGQLVAVAVALAGVVQLTVALGSLPWVTLVLAGSFACYGLVRKVAPIDPLPGFAVEMVLLTPAAGIYLAWLGGRGEAALPASAGVNALVACAGFVTAAPLLFFHAAAKRLPLAMVGFFQYLAPSLAFVLAVAVFGEPFTRVHVVTFACVWTALALFSIDAYRTVRSEITSFR